MFPLMIAATRARVALLVAGLAWLVGLDAPPLTRVVVGVLVLAAIAADGWVDEQRARHATKTTAGRFDTAA
jgi:hypothetical protein